LVKGDEPTMSKENVGISDDTDTQEVIERYPVISTLMGIMHGSGINSDWYALDKGGYIILYNSYESMNEAGMYDADTDFSITIDKTDVYNYTVRCLSRNRHYWNKYGLKEYIEDTFINCFGMAIKEHKGEYPIKSGIREKKTYELIIVKRD
jgi:hypothetical protein